MQLILGGKGIQTHFLHAITVVVMAVVHYLAIQNVRCTVAIMAILIKHNV
jgi:hypothetical protein